MLYRDQKNSETKEIPMEQEKCPLYTCRYTSGHLIPNYSDGARWVSCEPIEWRLNKGCAHYYTIQVTRHHYKCSHKSLSGLFHIWFVIKIADYILLVV